MHFEKLEIIGFKSFAEKTVLQFEPGVTTIVGPNGCGKSNVSDSIRWALGEQSSKSLRASRMEDVIFNGSHAKEPINFAEVSITLSNLDRSLSIDYDQVTISRRIYRSGENEYLLNKTPVRLKDINELLMGTGIGTESYSVIEQGKMDLVLSSRAEDRRHVFEEASGITKYKSKKREAMRKLADTENNLLRINDIIQEVKRQISSIERQARKAERYKQEYEKMKDLDLKVSSFEYKNLKSRERTSTVERDDVKSREREFALEITAINEKLTVFRNAVDELSKRSAELSGRYTETITAVDKNNHKIGIDKERIDEAKTLSESYSEEIASLKTKIARQEEHLKAVESELNAARRESAQNAALFESRDTRLKEVVQEIDALEAAVKRGKVKTIDLMTESTRLKNDLIKIGTELQARRARSRRLGVEKENTTTEYTAQVEKLDKAKALYVQAANMVTDRKRELDAKKLHHAAVVEEVRLLEGMLTQKQNTVAGLRSKLEFLEDLIRRREGFRDAVKSVLKKADESPGVFGRIHGVLADLILVDQEYRLAAEAALGEDAQTIVVDTDEDIMKAITFLEEGNAGRASFISLERLARISPGQAADNDHANGGIAFDAFVKAAPEYASLISHFLSGAFLVDSIEEILRKEIPRGVRYISKTGLVFDCEKISGGNLGDKGEVSIVGRRDKVGSLTAELEMIQHKVRELERDRAEKLAVLTDLGAAIEKEETALQEEQIAAANIESKKGSLEEVVSRIREEISVIDAEMEEVNQTIREFMKRGEEQNEALNRIENENAALQRSLGEARRAIEKRKEEKGAVLLDEASLKEKAAAMERELLRLDGSVRKEVALFDELKAALTAKQNALKDLSIKTEALKDVIARLEGQNEELTRSVSILHDDLSVIEKEKSDTTDKLSIEELQLKEKESELEQLKNQLRDMELKKMEVDYKMSSLKDKIQQAYKVGLDSFHIEIDESEDWESVRGQIDEIRGKLDNMGQVNLVAIDEHKELEERYSFLTRQQDDLVNAKESLHKAIQKINKTTKELFLETFEKIRVEFKDYFRLLFGGGQAELVLIDEQDVLESGIEIVARPPGKKLQNIMLMSGGEKALTAIALLFSIFKVRPSPFCILDEIDAPLDESNIDRFSKVLQDFVRMSQFIIITHNKKTIELADVMYGITMQDRGVSKIVSVKFLETGPGKDNKKTVFA